MIIPTDARMALVQAVTRAVSGPERQAVINAYAREWGVSEATARRHATPRVLRGTPTRRRGYPVSDVVLDQVVALWLASATEKYPEPTMPLDDVIDMAEVAGVLAHGVLSKEQLRRYIRENRITLAEQRRGAPHIFLRSEHPNHVHLADVSRCRQWYLRDDGQPDVQSYTAGTAEYRNKDLKGGVALYRYVVVDHTSNLPFVQYLTDEQVPTLLTFLAAAWFPKRQRREGERWWPAPFDPERYDEWAGLPMMRDYPFRGAPKVLILDRAGANQSEFTRQLCARLGIQHVLAQEARAKGAVESMMWIWERKFEARLAVQPAPDLATLNVWALDFLARWCLRARHSRHGLTRSQAWSQIEAEQLRELPDWRTFRELARREPELRTVKSGEPGCGLVYHEGRMWRLADASLIGHQVAVSYSVFSPTCLEARAGDGRVFLLEEIRKDRWGFPERAPVIGQAYARHPDTATQKSEKRLEAVRAALPPLHVFGREIGQRDTPALLPLRQGVEIALTTTIGAREITRTQFNARVKGELGRPLTEAEGAERDRRWIGQTTLAESSVAEFLVWCEAQAAKVDDAVGASKVVNLFR